MDRQRNNDFEFETLLWREGLGPKPVGTGVGIPRTRSTEGYAIAPVNVVQAPKPKTVDKQTSTQDSTSVNPFAAPLAEASRAAQLAASEVDTKPHLSDVLKRPGGSLNDTAAKRQCRSDRDANRLSPVEQEVSGTKSSATNGSGHGAKSPPESTELSANFTKLLEEQQKQNAKQSIRIAQLDEVIRVRDKTLAEKDEELKRYLGLEARARRLQDTIEARDDELKEKQEAIDLKSRECSQAKELLAAQDTELTA